MRSFLNRGHSIDRVHRFLSDAPVKRILQVVGSDGVGKTELLREAVRRQRTWRYVGVDCAETPEGGRRTALVSRVADCMDEQSGSNGFRSKRSMLPELTSSLKRSADAILNAAIQNQKSATAFRAWLERKGLPFGIDADSPEGDRYYVNLALADGPSVIHLDHADECPAEDWEFIEFIIAATQSVVFVESRMHVLPPRLRDEGRSSVINVPRLELRYADALFSELPSGLKARVRADFTSNGDLRSFGELFARRDRLGQDAISERDLNESMRGFSRDAVERLSDEDQRLVVAIAAHVGAPVSVGVLERFLERAAAPAVLDLHGRLKRLDDGLLIIRSSHDVQVPASIRDVISDDGRSETLLAAARKDWREFLRTAPASEVFIPHEQRWLQMLRQCVSLHDAVGVASCLEEIGSLHRGAGSMVDSVGLVKRLLADLELADDPIVAVAFARYLYVAGWFDDARDVLAPVLGMGSRRDKYLFAELLCAAGPVNQGVVLAKQELRRLEIEQRADPDAELCLRLVLLHGLRSSNRLEEARDLYLSIVGEERFRKCAAYPVLLRFSDVCLFRDNDFPTCVQALEAAVHTASLQGQWREVTAAQIALTQQFAYRDLDKAAASLAAAMSSEEAGWSQQLTIINNLHVLGMYKGVVTQDSVRALYSSLLLTQDPLDNLLVRNNILAAHMMLDLDLDSRFVEDLEASCDASSVDSEIRKIAYFNLSALFRKSQDHRNSEKLGRAWQEIVDLVDGDYWGFRRTGLGPERLPRWRASLDYYPVLLSDWKVGTVPFEALPDHG